MNVKPTKQDFKSFMREKIRSICFLGLKDSQSVCEENKLKQLLFENLQYCDFILKSQKLLQPRRTCSDMQQHAASVRRREEPDDKNSVSEAFEGKCGCLGTSQTDTQLNHCYGTNACDGEFKSVQLLSTGGMSDEDELHTLSPPSAEPGSTCSSCSASLVVFAK